MVDESHASGQAGRIPGNARYPLQSNPYAHLLEVGCTVKPTFSDSTARDHHPRGVILAITNGVATVRWETWQDEQYCVHSLFRVED